MPPRAPLPDSLVERMREDRRAVREVVVLVAALAGTTAAAVGGILSSLSAGALGVFGVRLFVGGLVGVVVAVVVSRPVRLFSRVHLLAVPEDRYGQLRQWTRLKATSILLQLLVLFALATMAVAVLGRLGVLSIPQLPYLPVLRAAMLLTVALIVTLTVTLLVSLTTELVDRPRLGLEPFFVYTGAAGALVLAGVGAVVAAVPVEVAGGLFQQTDAPFFLVGATGLAALTLFAARTVPGIYILLTDERAYYRGFTHFSERRKIVLPAMIALAFLFLVVLLIFVFGFGIAGVVEQVPGNAVLLGAIAFSIAALATTAVFAVVLARREEGEEEPELYKPQRSRETTVGYVILGVSLTVAAVLWLLAAWLFLAPPVLGLAQERWLDLMSFGWMAALGPYGFYIAARYRRRRRLEERFPDFLRDLASSRRAGLTLTHAVQIAAKGEYGDLTPEIVKMADQLALNVSFEEALVRFGDRVETPLVQRSVSLILEASRSGGNVTDVLMAAAKDAREIKGLEGKRTTQMSLYTAIIYITFLVFLAVAAILFATFVPEIVRAQELVTQGGIRGFAGLQFGNLSLNDFRTFYFLAALMQGLGNGMIAGLVETGRPLSGLRHSFIMVLVTWVTFAILIAA